MLRLDDDTFVNHIHFGPHQQLIVQFRVLDPRTLNLVLHTHNQHLHYVSFLQWLYWIFAIPNSY